MTIESAETATEKKTLTALDQQLRTSQDLFIRRWGEMGQTWGINRTMAEIHALLYITGQPQCTDDVMERLNISRGNASMSLRAVCDWGIIRRLHKRGERREYYESLGDVWEMFSIIAAERKRREMDPVLETIKQCQRMLDESSLGKSLAKQPTVIATRQRLASMEEFMEVTNKIFQQFVNNARERADAHCEGAAEGALTQASSDSISSSTRRMSGMSVRLEKSKAIPAALKRSGSGRVPPNASAAR